MNSLQKESISKFQGHQKKTSIATKFTRLEKKATISRKCKTLQAKCLCGENMCFIFLITLHVLMTHFNALQICDKSANLLSHQQYFVTIPFKLQFLDYNQQQPFKLQFLDKTKSIRLFCYITWGQKGSIMTLRLLWQDRIRNNVSCFTPWTKISSFFMFYTPLAKHSNCFSSFTLPGQN